MISRLNGLDIFEKSSIKFIANKVSTNSGDVRKSLQITIMAIEICKDEFIKS